MNHFLTIIRSFVIAILMAFASLAQDFGTVEGTVKSSEGKPIAGVTVYFKNSIKKATTNFDGKFTVEKMYPAKYTAFVFKYGYKTFLREDVKVGAGLTTTLEIALERDAINQGCGTITGRILDKNDKPIADAKIIFAESFVPKSDDIVTIEDFILKGTQIEASSDRDGNFVIENVPPGRFTAFVMKDSYKSHMHFAIYVETGKTKNIEAKLHEQQFSSIYGKVKSTDDEAIPGANVFLEGTLRGAASDVSGNYLIQNVPPGKYVMNVTMLGFKPYQQSITVEKNKYQKLAVKIEPDLSFKSQKKTDSQAYEDRLEELRQAYFLAESAADQEEMKNQIREFLKIMFDYKEKEYAKEIESKKRNIQALEQLQKYRAENKDDIIERRLKELLTVY
ncbi:carboxypeptidase regulatory-like domain-containing protein [candidate division KSB1 bacterium]|nr:carboxypeptidase regulatory-like domain-containing protein [candidate division KSB1 bacterium]